MLISGLDFRQNTPIPTKPREVKQRGSFRARLRGTTTVFESLHKGGGNEKDSPCVLFVIPEFTDSSHDKRRVRSECILVRIIEYTRAYSLGQATPLDGLRQVDL